MKRLDFSRLSPDIEKLLHEIGTIADEDHISVWMVGGMVRDLIMGRPSYDLDIIVEGNGMVFASKLTKLWGAQSLAHRRFGTTRLNLPNGLRVDVVTARRESYAQPGVLPDVIFGQIADDLFRRDFTINAIAVSLNAHDFGVLKDDFDGMKDIDKKLIRIMHYRSFVDDPTRILRAVRYEKRLGFRLESRTLAALKVACQEDAFMTITPVRYFNELRNILNEADPVAPLRRLRSLDGLRYFTFGSSEEKLLEKIVRSQEASEGSAMVCPFWIPRLAGLMVFLERKRAEDLLNIFNVSRQDKQKTQQFLHFLSVPDMLGRLNDLRAFMEKRKV